MASSINPTPVAHTSWNSGAVTNVNSPTINTTGANYIIVSVATLAGTGGATAPTDNMGNSPTEQFGPADESGGGGVTIGIYYYETPTVGSGHVFTSTSPFQSIIVSAWSGTAGSGAFDFGCATATGALLVTSINAASGTPTNDGSLVYVVATNFTSSNASISGGGVSTVDQIPTGNSSLGSFAGAVVQGAKTAASPLYTMSTSEPVTILMITIAPASYTPPGSSIFIPTLLLMGTG